MKRDPGGRSLAIAELRCPGRHGAYPGERDATRTFLVDVDVRGALADDDVMTLVAVARQAVAARSHALLESVAADVGDAILVAVRGVAAVQVRVTKPDPPGLGASSEAVSLTRSRRRRPGAHAPSGPRGRTDGRHARG
jgi:dihydroneopterin aldolase